MDQFELFDDDDNFTEEDEDLLNFDKKTKHNQLRKKQNILLDKNNLEKVL